MTRKKVNTILLLIMFVLLFGVSIGYSALSQVLNISGSTAYSHHVNASNLSYDNSSSGLSATTAQAAIDELVLGGQTGYPTTGGNVYVVSTTYTNIGSLIPSGVNVRTNSSGAINDWLNIYSTTQPVYLIHHVNPNYIIDKSYVEVQISSTFASNNSAYGTIEDIYYFQGGDGGDSYSSNLTKLRRICGSAIESNSTDELCSINGGTFHVHNDGHIEINMSDHRCHVWGNGSSRCY